MMNEHGKSDRPVVPAKFPNKAGQPAAEGTEGSGLTKGNPQRQNAPRMQRRIDAPNALERVRQAASKDKELRFTALLHRISAAVRPAFDRCSRAETRLAVLSAWPVIPRSNVDSSGKLPRQSDSLCC